MQKVILLVNNDLISAQRNLDLVIESILNAQKGTFQPQIVSPSLFMVTEEEHYFFFPQGYTGTIFFNKDSIGTK
jgi:hypothetical protein